MNDSPNEGWTHTAIIAALPPEGVARSVVGVAQDAAAVVLASPEFDEVSFHLVLETPENPRPTSPAIDTLLLKALADTEASTIALVWCGHGGVEDPGLTRDLDSLHAVRADSVLVAALRDGVPAADVAVRDTVIAALEAAEGNAGTPRAVLEEALAEPPIRSGQGSESPATRAIDRRPEETADLFGEPPAQTPQVFPSEADVPVTAEQSALALPHEKLAPLEHSSAVDSGPTVPVVSPATPELAEPASANPWNSDDAPLTAAAVEDTDSRWDAASEGVTASDVDAAFDEEQSGPWRPAAQYPQPQVRQSAWLPPAVRDAFTSLTTQVDEWRAGRSKLRRAEERVGVAELEQLQMFPGVHRPLLYFAMAASTEWDKQAVRTRNAALTLITSFLDRRWVAVAVNLGASLARVAGPTVPELVAREWKRIDRSNDFDLGAAASALSEQLARDAASLRLRGHDVGAPHLVVFATEPPYVDSAAHGAYQALLGDVQSVTWLLVGESDWMEVPAELKEAPSRVLHAEQDGAAILLAEVLSPAAPKSDE